MRLDDKLRDGEPTVSFESALMSYFCSISITTSTSTLSSFSTNRTSRTSPIGLPAM